MRHKKQTNKQNKQTNLTDRQTAIQQTDHCISKQKDSYKQTHFKIDKLSYRQTYII